MAKNKTSNLEFDLHLGKSHKELSGMDIFSESFEKIAVPDAEPVPTPEDIPFLDSTSVPMVEDASSTVEENAPYLEEQVKSHKRNNGNQKLPMKKTSIRIKRSSANFLTYQAQCLGISQFNYLSLLIEEDSKIKSKDFVPDFNNTIAKRQRVSSNNDIIVKGIELPEDVLAQGRILAAKELKNFSRYIDDLLQKELSQIQA